MLGGERGSTDPQTGETSLGRGDGTRAVVTGVAGFIGSRLARLLLARGHAVLGVDDFSDSYDPALKRGNVGDLLCDPHFELLAGHLARVDIEAALSAGDVVVHLAGDHHRSGGWDPDAGGVGTAVAMAHRVLEAARRASCARVILVSWTSGALDSRPISPYAVSVRAVEEMGAAYRSTQRIHVVIYRFGDVHGDGRPPEDDANLEGRLFDMRPVAVDPVHVDEVVRCLAAAVAHAPATSVVEAAAVPAPGAEQLGLIVGGPRAPLPRTARPTAPRILLHSYDTVGLGHVRRSLALAHALKRRVPASQLLMLTGSPVGNAWGLPPDTEFVTLPPVIKARDASVVAASGGDVLPVIARRRAAFARSLVSFRPDVVLIDHDPLGVRDELELGLAMVRELLPATRLVLGMRDIVDHPSVVRSVWTQRGTYDFIAQTYDEILVFGSRHLNDVVHEYALGADLAERVRYVGYVARDGVDAREHDDGLAWSRAATSSPRILAMGGGGADAGDLFDRFLDDWPEVHAATGGTAILITGPMLDEALRERVLGRGSSMAGLQLATFTTRTLALIGGADLVVSMAGYNTVVEGLTARRRLLLCPRVHPRREQLIRAQILQRIGVASIHRLDERGGHHMGASILAALAAAPPDPGAWEAFDLRGADAGAGALLAVAGCD